MKVALYARVSTTRQEQEQTISSQLAALREYATSQELLFDDAHIYLDDGYSGARLDRPGLDHLRDAAQAGLIDLVLVHSPDRLARDYVWQQVVIADLKRHGCVACGWIRSRSTDLPMLMGFIIAIRTTVAEAKSRLRLGGVSNVLHVWCVLTGSIKLSGARSGN